MDLRKIAALFTVAVLVPTLVLAWLALRSLHNQEIVANSQRAILHQSATESLASDLNTFMDDVRVFFNQLLDDLIQEHGPDELSQNFDQMAPGHWAQCSIACVVTDEGEILCPAPTTVDARAQSFLKFNAPFLLNRSNARVYEAAPVNQTGPVVAENQLEQTTPELSLPTEPHSPAPNLSNALANPSAQYKVAIPEQKMRSFNQFRPLEQPANPLPNNDLQTSPDPADHALLRNVRPSQSVYGPQGFVYQNKENDNFSRLEWGDGNMKELIEGKTEGALSRFIHDGLHVMLWKRHPQAKDRIFWVELDLRSIKNDLSKIITSHTPHREVCLALLDAEGQVVSKTDPTFTTDWSKPFVASEVGQILPHWEVAAYLLNPEAGNQTAQTARFMIWLLVPSLLAAIVIGMFLIFRSVGMEMRIARHKTDFVSNVSHELKTPLTSIRMFSDLLNSGAMSQKDREYSEIISREAARLTRLINNLLDFSRLERADTPYHKSVLDLADLTRETIETYRMQIEAEGCHLVYHHDPATQAQVLGDRDALSQVLLNLLSNAEKYGGNEGEIEVRLVIDSKARIAEWQVLDQGKGIDRRHAAKIFEKFYRIDNSLSSGIPGSGLGLALARQIVIHHGGEIFFENRPSGGGCCFSVRLPIENEPHE
jgi:signal transduction histidine kinase